MKNVHGKLSVAKIITSAFIVIVCIFMLVIIISNTQLSNLQSLVSKITLNSLPQIILSKNMHTQVNELLYYANRLANVSNKASLNIVSKEIENKISMINQDINLHKKNIGLVNQLNVITNELSDLTILIENKLLIQSVMTKKQATLYQLYDKTLLLPNHKSIVPVDNLAVNNWVLSFSETILLTNKAISNGRLQNVRQIYRSIKNKIDILDKNATTLPLIIKPQAIQYVIQLRQLLLKDDGLLLIKIEQLQIQGRVIGRGNFVKNLVTDFSTMTESKSFIVNQSVKEEANKLNQQISFQIQIMAVISFVIFMILIIVIYYIKKRFVERLLHLNKHVLARIYGQESKLDITGHDEISEIAQSFNYFAEKIEQQKMILHEQSITDGLTGLSNRRALDQQLHREVHIANRNKWKIAVLLMDIDFFKAYNDTYGHIAGDECLKHVATALLQCKKRQNDFVGRYGGEEFIFILPNTELDGAQKVAMDILNKINALEIKHDTSPIAPHITLSIGISIYHHDCPSKFETIIKNADTALYQAKSQGKNCIQHFN